MKEVILILGFVCLTVGFILGLVFLALDWTVGEHGRMTITAVDKNLFGTHTIYARNSDSLSGNETLEVRYCIDKEDTAVVALAKEAIGLKNTKLIYPEKRIGFFLFDKCRSAPIKQIVLE